MAQNINSSCAKHNYNIQIADIVVDQLMHIDSITAW